jgi:predicted nucleic acid-binding protein
VSVLTHFQVLWGYGKAGLAATRYRDFLAKLSVNVAPLVEEDAAVGAQRKPTRENVVDALISATVSRYGATIWTKDKDFLRYMPKEKVKVV